MIGTMSGRTRKLLRDAMNLAAPERAELAADLLASLDGEPDGEVEARADYVTRPRGTEITARARLPARAHLQDQAAALAAVDEAMERLLAPTSAHRSGPVWTRPVQ